MRADAWKKHACHAAGQRHGVDVMGEGIMECLPVEGLLDMVVTIEQVFIPGRARRRDVYDERRGCSLTKTSRIDMER